MTQAEFVDLHGLEAWERLVEPLQRTGDLVQRSNANILVHLDLISQSRSVVTTEPAQEDAR